LKERRVNASELKGLSAYLTRVLGAAGVAVTARGAEEGDVAIGGRSVAEVVKDVDEGETSYTVSLVVARAAGAKKNAPIDDAERARLQGALRATLGSPRLEVRPRPRKTDSAEVYVGDEFIGTLSADEDEGYFLTMSILDIDLDA
jgi:hypothetical protein